MLFRSLAAAAALLVASTPVAAQDLDLRAQVAACAKGSAELGRMVEHFSLPVVRAYMRHVQDNAEESVRRVITRLSDGAFTLHADWLVVADGARSAASTASTTPARRAPRAD